MRRDSVLAALEVFAACCTTPRRPAQLLMEGYDIFQSGSAAVTNITPNLGSNRPDTADARRVNLRLSPWGESSRDPRRAGYYCPVTNLGEWHMPVVLTMLVSMHGHRSALLVEQKPWCPTQCRAHYQQPGELAGQYVGDWTSPQ
jgi:hypothetical protein